MADRFVGKIDSKSETSIDDEFYTVITTKFTARINDAAPGDIDEMMAELMGKIEKPMQGTYRDYVEVKVSIGGALIEVTIIDREARGG